MTPCDRPHLRRFCLTLAVFLIFLIPLRAHAGEETRKKQVQDFLRKAPGAFKIPPMPKVGNALRDLHAEFRSFKSRGLNGKEGSFKARNRLLAVEGETVTVDAIAKEDPQALKAELEGLGLKHGAVYGNIVSGVLPIEAIDKLPRCRYLNLARPAMAATRVGSATSLGDLAMRSDIARGVFGVDGTGVTVGVLSDSYDCLGGAGADIASGDLPAAGVAVLDDRACPGSDEGRAMMQLIHDVAPGAALSFHTAFLGLANFANGILDLAAAGADVIVDDVIYFAEPMFQDGILAQVVDAVHGAGIPYISSAGNSGRDSYEDAYRGVGAYGLEAHDFDAGPGEDVLQKITIPSGGELLLSFQWDSPALSSGGAGSPNDIDIYLLDEPPTRILAAATDFNVGLDPVEILFFPNTTGATEFNLLIVRAAGAAPGRLKYVRFGDSTPQEHDTKSSSLYGHANAVGAEAIGATAWFNTPELNAGLSSPVINGFSSAGGTPILLETSGVRKAAAEVRLKPGVVGPDGGSTTFFGSPDLANDLDSFPDFFGTSASAAHVAGVAALLKSADPALTPAEIHTALEKTAQDMDDPDTAGFDTGFDFATGFGFVQADAAVAEILNTDCDLVADPLLLDFGVHTVGTATALPLGLTNTGRDDCEIQSLAFSGSGDFQLTPPAPAAPFTLVPGAPVEVSVDFTPSGAGPHTGVLTVASNDPDRPEIAVDLAGTGEAAPMANADLKLRHFGKRRTRTGSTLWYMIRVKNRGPDPATGIRVEDTLPSTVEFVSASPGCTLDGGTVTCAIDSLMKGARKLLYISVRPTERGRIVNRVSVAANENDPNPANNSAKRRTRVR